MKRFKSTTYRDKHYNRRRKQTRTPQGVDHDRERNRRMLDELWKRAESR